MKRIPLEGQVFNQWTVLSFLRTSYCGHAIYECRCSCGKVEEVYSNGLTTGTAKWCNECSKKNKQKASPFFNSGAITSDWWGHHVTRLKVPVEMSPEELWGIYLHQDGVCCVTKEKITIGKGPSYTGTARLIDKERGFVEGNVQFIHKKIIGKSVFAPGEKIGGWTVIKEDRSPTGMRKYVCRCECGQEKSVYAKHLKSGSSKRCVGCSNKTRGESPHWTGFGEISGSWWSTHVGYNFKKAHRAHIEITINPEHAWNLFLKQNQKCALTGLELKIADTKECTASIDRIDSSKGYVPGNIQWVHKDINKMKNVYSVEYFVDMCKRVAAIK